MKSYSAILIIILSFTISACGSNFEWFPDSPDTRAPTISGTIAGKAVFGNHTTTVTALPERVQFTASEASTVFYTIDNSEPTALSPSVYIATSIPVDGPLITVTNTILKFFGIDDSKEKNISAVQTATIKLAAVTPGGDTTPPTIAAAIGGRTVLNNLTTNVSNLPATVLFAADEPAIVYYTINGETPTEASPSVDIVAAATPVNGPAITLSSTILKFFGIDKATAKNKSAVQTTTVVDATPPVVQASVNGTVVANNTTAVSSLPVTVKFAASEPSTIYYTTSGTDPTTASTSIEVAPPAQTDGPSITFSNTVLKFFGIDRTGNRNPAAQTITIVSP